MSTVLILAVIRSVKRENTIASGEGTCAAQKQVLPKLLPHLDHIEILNLCALSKPNTHSSERIM